MMRAIVLSAVARVIRTREKTQVAPLPLIGREGEGLKIALSTLNGMEPS